MNKAEKKQLRIKLNDCLDICSNCEIEEVKKEKSESRKDVFPSYCEKKCEVGKSILSIRNQLFGEVAKQKKKSAYGEVSAKIDIDILNSKILEGNSLEEMSDYFDVSFNTLKMFIYQKRRKGIFIESKRCAGEEFSIEKYNEMIKDGVTQNKIIKYFRIGVPKLHSYLEEAINHGHHVEVKKTNEITFDINKYHDLLSSGMKKKDIADKFGMSYDSMAIRVRRYKKKHMDEANKNIKGL